MLIEQLQNMQALLEARNERRSEKKSLLNLSNQEGTLKGLLVSWQGLSQLASSWGFEESIVQQFRTEVRAIGERFEAEIPIQQTDIRQLQERIGELEGDLKTRWTDQQRSLLEDALLAHARIAFVIGAPQARTTLRQTYSNIHNLLNLPFLTANEFRALKKAWSQMEDELRQALPFMSQEVASFLEKLSVGQATLNDLNPEIVAWCHDQHLLEQISLRFTGG